MDKEWSGIYTAKSYRDNCDLAINLVLQDLQDYIGEAIRQKIGPEYIFEWYNEYKEMETSVYTAWGHFKIFWANLKFEFTEGHIIIKVQADAGKKDGEQLINTAAVTCLETDQLDFKINSVADTYYELFQKIDPDQRVRNAMTRNKTKFLFRNIPELGNVSISLHAQDNMERDNISEKDLRELLFKGEDTPEREDVIRREFNDIRAIILLNPTPDRGSKLIKTIYRVT